MKEDLKARRIRPLKKEGEAAGEGGEDKPGRNRRSCRRIVARTTVQCHLLSAVDAPFAGERTPLFPPRIRSLHMNGP